MIKVTTVLYRLFTRFLNGLPFTIRNTLFSLWKKSKIPFNKFYRDLPFYGILKINDSNCRFIMQSTGGTIENEIFWKGLKNSLEPETIWIWKHLMGKGINTIIDIGANTGLYSLLSSSINKNCTVIAFEPSKNTYAKLVKNIQLNKFKIKHECMALSYFSGERVFYEPNVENQSNATLSPIMAKFITDNSGQINEYMVKTTSLDEYLKSNKQIISDLVKIDVELHEPSVFKGMKDTMESQKPFILFEVLTNDIANDLNYLFESFPDYELYSFIKTKESFRLKKVKTLSGKPDGNWNYFACPDNRKSNIVGIIAE